MLHELFHVVSRFPRYILCYIAESRLSLGQCRAPVVATDTFGQPEQRWPVATSLFQDKPQPRR